MIVTEHVPESKMGGGPLLPPVSIAPEGDAVNEAVPKSVVSLVVEDAESV